MNQLTENLLDQCYIETYGVNGELLEYGFDAEKFAELIINNVTECVRDVLRDENSELTYAACDQIQQRIKQHFGVDV